MDQRVSSNNYCSREDMDNVLMWPCEPKNSLGTSSEPFSKQHWSWGNAQRPPVSEVHPTLTFLCTHTHSPLQSLCWPANYFKCHSSPVASLLCYPQPSSVLLLGTPQGPVLHLYPNTHRTPLQWPIQLDEAYLICLRVPGTQNSSWHREGTPYVLLYVRK